MMKKLLSLLLSLLLALSAASALAAKGDANLAMSDDIYTTYGDGVNGCFVIGDTLYLWGGSHLFLWKQGDADLRALKFDPPGDAEDSLQINYLFCDGERILALCSAYLSDDTSYRLNRLSLMELTIEGETVGFHPLQDLPLEDLSTDYGDGENLYLIQINDICCIDGTAFLLIYDDSGTARVLALDLASGETGYLDAEYPCQIAAYAEGALLIETYDYNAGACEVLSYDPQSESLTSITGPLPMDSYRYYSGIAYSRESGRLFYTADGFVMAAQGFDFDAAVPVAEFSTMYGSDRSGLLLPGDYYVFCSYDVTCVRATDPDQLPETQLTILNSSYTNAVSRAYYAFGAAHDDVAVVLSQDYLEDSQIIERMMNRDASVDIYLLSAQSQAFDALFSRGYMAEIDDPEIRAAVEKMYPAVQAVLMRDGEVVAIPVGVYGWSMGVDTEALALLGFTPEELPSDWLGLLDFLEALPEHLPEDGNVRIFDDYMTQKDCRLMLMGMILQDHILRTGSDGSDPSFDTPALRAVLEKLMHMDFASLGLKESDEDEDGGSVAVEYAITGGRRSYTLLQLGSGCTLGNFYSGYEPLLLSVDPDETAQLPLELNIAFINPFSEHVDLAQEFLLEIMNCAESDVLYNVSDEYNEPLRNRYYQQTLDFYDKAIADAKAALEKAEPVDRPVLEQNLKDLEEGLASAEQYSWEISQESLDWYRAHAGQLAVSLYNPIYSDAGGEIEQLLSQYMEGRIDTDAFLKGVDKKVRMMILEGN